MRIARHPSSDLRYEAERIPLDAGGWPKPLRCAHCSTDVVAVQGFVKEKTNSSPYFRLRQGYKHEDTCLFNIEVRITELQKLSGGALRKVPGKQLYRLPWPSAFDRPSNRSSSGSPADLVFGRQATTLLNTAAKVAELIERYEMASTPLEEQFEAVCHGEYIQWLNFFYDRGRSWQLDDRLRKSPLSHPVAVVLRPDIPTLGTRWVFSHAGRPQGQTVEDDPEKTPKIRFSVRADEELLRQIFQIGQPGRPKFYIAFGMWELWGGNEQHIDRATLHIDDDDTSAIAPLPQDLHPAVAERWQKWKNE